MYLCQLSPRKLRIAQASTFSRGNNFKIRALNLCLSCARYQIKKEVLVYLNCVRQSALARAGGYGPSGGLGLVMKSSDL